MSLINEALKKAQRTRHLDSAAPPPIDPHLGERVRRRGEGPDTKTVVLIALTSIAACALVVVAVVLLLNRRTEDRVIATTPAAVTANPASTIASEPVPAPVIAVSEPSPEPADVATPIISTAQPAAAEPAPPIVRVSPAPSPPEPETVSTTAAAPAAGSPTAQAATEAAVAPTREVPSVPTSNPAVVEFLERLRVAGVRASATDPKVLMNDRVYRLNDVVNRPLGLRLTGISTSTLIFVDESGFEYTKTF